MRKLQNNYLSEEGTLYSAQEGLHSVTSADSRKQSLFILQISNVFILNKFDSESFVSTEVKIFAWLLNH